MTRIPDDPAKQRSEDFSLDDHLPLSNDEEIGDDDAWRTKSISDASIFDISKSDLSDRFRITELLGEGGYGSVFKAFDEQLERFVAIKIPHRERVTSPERLDQYLAEARTLAKLDHPAIVSIFDVLRMPDGLPCIVSAYIDGTNLADRMEERPLTLRHALELLTEIGNALAYVHSQGIVHRDIKPGNILLSQEEKPFLVDFGLALRDEDIASHSKRVGTLAYMSPEQARGENHLVDGRSDLFSLGVILYQMLTGQRPFGGSDHRSIIVNLINREPQPPRQIVGSIPKDLERICLKMLSKRATDRYATASDFVEDVDYFLDSSGEVDANETTVEFSGATPTSHVAIGVVPRGLRSYGRHDAEYFQKLIPGPRDRDWVPESLRFWERRITGREESEVPRVGVLYGPSGCGKSSFVKAGLLPLLGKDVDAVFVESTRDETELRLLRGVRRARRDLGIDLTLSQALAEVRRRSNASGGRKLLLVIDQFEQWLHGRDEADPELAMALRQCDGVTVQCLLLVRDDFWLALTRFMSVIEVPLRQNHNAAMVDLFTPSHARKVLGQFGIAYDRIPEEPDQRSDEQNQFLDLAVDGLTRGGKVFPVRLAVFVEMLKNQPWEAETIRRLGGVEGIGLQFLEEAFSSELAPAAQRVHEPAVRNVLKRLLPEPNVDIKGKMQSEQALLEASGYENDLDAFYEMIRILDKELRLITPTDPAGATGAEESISQSGDGVAYYQLTHDYLVPAVERWITRRQRETRQGRAELRLAEYASVWAVKPSSKFAPSWIDWATIRILSSPDRWNATERLMMRSATRNHLLRGSTVIAVMLIAGTLGWFAWKSSRADAAVQQLQTVRADELNRVLEEIREHGGFATRPLQRALDDSRPQDRTRILNQLGLLQQDPSLRMTLIEQAPELDLPLLMVLREQLGELNDGELQTVSDVLRSSDEAAPRRLRAAILISGHLQADADNRFEVRDEESEVVVEEMLRHASFSPQDNRHLIDGLDSLTSDLSVPLIDRALQQKDSPIRSLSTAFVIQLLRDRPGELLDFFLDSSFEQHPSIIAVLNDHLPELLGKIREIVFTDLDGSLPEPEYDRFARRQGVAAALLHRLGQAESTWPLMRWNEWPHARGYLINRVGPLGGDFETLLNRFSHDVDPSAKRALLLAMGGFDWSAIPETVQAQARLVIRSTFKKDTDIGIHSAAEWLLRRWGESSWLEAEVMRQSKLPFDVRKDWYVTPHGHTMAIIDGREEPSIGRVFAISVGEVTVEQYYRYLPGKSYFEVRSPTPDCPMGTLHWIDCARYCRWLSEQFECEAERSYPPSLNPNSLSQSFDDVLEGGAYRLPTPEEWRFACAALTTSRRFYGWSDALADDYYWHYDSSLIPGGDCRYHPAGTRMPNDFGMFSMYDGVREWCHSKKGNRRYVLGFASSSNRDRPETLIHEPIESLPGDLPMALNGYYGMRIARTITSE